VPSTTFGPGGQRLFAENTRAGERLASQWPVPAAAALYESFALSTPTRQDREAQTVHATIRQMLGNRTLHGPRRMRRAVTDVSSPAHRAPTPELRHSGNHARERATRATKRTGSTHDGMATLAWPASAASFASLETGALVRDISRAICTQMSTQCSRTRCTASLTWVHSEHH